MSFLHSLAGTYPHTHETVAEARDCEWDAQEARAEIYAEDAWLRAAEAGTPDTWREEDLERMSAAFGLPIPPGMR